MRKAEVYAGQPPEPDKGAGSWPRFPGRSPKGKLKAISQVKGQSKRATLICPFFVFRFAYTLGGKKLQGEKNHKKIKRRVKNNEHA